MRLAKIFTVAILSAGLIFSSCLGFFIEKTEAASPPTSQTGGYPYTFSDQTNSTISAKFSISNTPQTFTFSSTGSTYTSSQFDNTSFFNQPEISGRTIYLYSLTSPTNISCVPHQNSGSAQAPEIVSGQSSPFYLIVSKSPSTTYMANGFVAYNSFSNKYTFLKSSNDVTSFCGLSGSTSTLINALTDQIANLGDSVGIVSSTGSNINDIASYCSQMSTDWENLKQTIRAILVPAPGTDTNANWTNTQESTTYTINWGDIGSFYATQILAHGTTAAEQSWWNVATDKTIQYHMTASGLNAFQSASQTAQTLADKTSALIAQYGGNSWPANCTPLTEFKIDKSLSANNYDSLNDFAAKLDLIMSNFKKFTDILGSATTSATGNDACGNIVGNFSSGGWTGIFDSIGCGIGEFLNKIMGAALNLSISLLQSFVGVKIQFTTPSTPGSTSGANGSGSSGGNGSGGVAAAVDFKRELEFL